MQCGTPSVTSSIGAEAMAGDLEWNGFIIDDSNEFVASVIALYSDVSLWEKSQKKGYNILEKRYQKASFESEFINRVYSLKENLKQHRNANFMGSILQFHLNSSTKYMSKWIEEKNKK
jgi:glycosyltransferase involved in cell wall biosynthesis